MITEYEAKNKVLQYFVLYICFGFAMLWKEVMYPGEYISDNPLYLGFVFFLFALVTAFFIGAIREINKKITTDNYGITIEKPFRKIRMQWDEIIEFGRVEKGFGAGAGWRYYLKSDAHGNKQIMIADNNMDRLDDLIKTIFENAKSSRFIEISNEAEMPFSKDWQIDRWKKRPDRSL